MLHRFTDVGAIVCVADHCSRKIYRLTVKIIIGKAVRGGSKGAVSRFFCLRCKGNWFTQFFRQRNGSDPLIPCIADIFIINGLKFSRYKKPPAQFPQFGICIHSIYFL